MNTEYYYVIKAFTLPKRGRISLPGGIGLCIGPDRVGVVIGGGSPRAFSLERTLHGKPGISRLVCPTCGRATHRLFITPDKTRIGCRRCLGIDSYRQWERNGRVREPKTDEAWVQWFLRRSKRGGDVR